jgi:hypothetical protein
MEPTPQKIRVEDRLRLAAMADKDTTGLQVVAGQLLGVMMMAAQISLETHSKLTATHSCSTGGKMEAMAVAVTLGSHTQTMWDFEIKTMHSGVLHHRLTANTTFTFTSQINKARAVTRVIQHRAHQMSNTV